MDNRMEARQMYTCPLLPLETINQILSYQEKSDLLACRLVCKDWDKLCREHLKKCGVPMYLETDRIEEYVKFVIETKAPVLLPFKLIFNIEGGKPAWCNPVTWKLLRYLDQLIMLPGSLPIISLSWYSISKQEHPIVFLILQKLSTELISLKIKPLAAKFETNILVECLRNQIDLNFPKLNKLVCWHSKRRERKVLELYSTIVERCPRLQTLKLRGPFKSPFCDLEVKFPFEQLKCLYLRYFKDPTLLLQQLKLCEKKPKLQHFYHDFDGQSFTNYYVDFYDKYNSLVEILELFSSTLKTLSYPILFNGFFIPCRASMPALKRLEIRISAFSVDGIANPIYMGSRPINMSHIFPVLRTVNIPIGLFWTSCDYQMQILGSIPTVTCIEFQIHLSSPNGNGMQRREIPALSLQSIKEYMDHIFQVFPNSSVLSVTPYGNCCDSLFEIYMRRVICVIIKHSHAKSIKEFSIWGYTRDFLGEILREIDNPPRIKLIIENLPCIELSKKARCMFDELLSEMSLQMATSDFKSIVNIEESNSSIIAESEDFGEERMANHLTGVEKICLQPMPDTSTPPTPLQIDFKDLSEASSKIRGFLHLESFEKHLPNLRTLEISSKVLSPMGWRTDAWEIAQQIKERFPKWVVLIV